MGEEPEQTPELPTVASTIELRDSMILTLVDQQHRVLRTVRRWLVAGFLVLALALGIGLWGIGAIRHTQNAHSPIVACQSKALNGLLKDVPLAFAGDRNVHDYARIAPHC